LIIDVKLNDFKLFFRGSAWKGYFDILDERRNAVLKLRGPCCIWDGACCPCENEFQVSKENLIFYKAA
jgi:hypothetical protein